MKLNSAGLLAQLFVNSKLTPLIILSALIVGVFAFIQTPKEETPQILIPSVQVAIPVPGSSIEEIEQLVIKPAEAAILAIPGVKHVNSITRENLGLILAEFEVGFSKSDALVLVNERMNTIVQDLSRSAQAPQITAVDINDVPFMTITLGSDAYSERDLRQLADKVADYMRNMDGVSLIRIQGGQAPLVDVQLQADKLLAYNISASQIEGILRASNFSQEVGQFANNNQIYRVHLDASLNDVESLKRLIVGNYAGLPIYLEQLAQIQWRTEYERKQFSFISKRDATGEFPEPQSAVTLSIAKKQGSDSVKVAQAIHQRMDEIKARLIPPQVEVYTTRDDGDKADKAVNNLIVNLFLSMLTVVFVSALFMGFRNGFIIGFSVPLILSLVLLTDYIFGISINRVTLFALILSMGMLVDAATVVIDNIIRNPERSQSPARAIVTSVNEIGGATNLATFSIMLVFSSMIVVTGMAGEFFYPLTFNVPVAMLFSLLVAYIIVPWCSHYWLDHQQAHTSSTIENLIVDRFKNPIRQVLDNRQKARTFLIGVAVAMALALGQLSWQFVRPQGPDGPLSWLSVPVSVLPKDDQNRFIISIRGAENYPLEKTLTLVNAVEQQVQHIPEVMQYQVFLGYSGPETFNTLFKGIARQQGEHIAEIQINLADKTSRQRSSIDIVKAMRPAINTLNEDFPEADILLVESPPGPPVRSTIQAEIYGEDPAQMQAIARIVKQRMQDTWGTTEITTSEEQDIGDIELKVNHEKALSVGINLQELAKLLLSITRGQEIGTLNLPGEQEQVKVYLGSSDEDRFSEPMLDLLSISNSQGVRFPLREFVEIHERTAPKTILRKNGARVSFVGAELTDSAPFYVVLGLDKTLEDLKDANGQAIPRRNLGITPQRPDTLQGESIHWEGEVRMSLDIFRDLLLALCVALLAVYLILIAYYRSFSLPVLAMAAIPLSLIGIFPGHWLMGMPFSGPSLIGVIALAGIVMRNSLLIIDFTATQLRNGLTLEDAILKATTLRLPAISLTALTVVLGSLFMLSDPVFGGLAVSLIFGTTSATLLTPILIPLLLGSYIRRLGLAQYLELTGASNENV